MGLVGLSGPESALGKALGKALELVVELGLALDALWERLWVPWLEIPLEPWKGSWWVCESGKVWDSGWAKESVGHARHSWQDRQRRFSSSFLRP